MAWLAAVVTALCPRSSTVSRAVRVRPPALPAPVLSAETTAPFSEADLAGLEGDVSPMPAATCTAEECGPIRQYQAGSGDSKSARSPTPQGFYNQTA